MLYILSDGTGFKGFEDYCTNLLKKIQQVCEVKLIIFKKVKEINIDADNVYLFFYTIPDYFIDLWKNGKCKKIYLLNLEQLSRQYWNDRVKEYIDMGLTVIDYDHYHCQSHINIFLDSIIPILIWD